MFKNAYAMYSKTWKSFHTLSKSTNASLKIENTFILKGVVAFYTDSRILNSDFWILPNLKSTKLSAQKIIKTAYLNGNEY